MGALVNVRFDATPRGPIFDRSADTALADYARAIADVAGREGRLMVRRHARVFRNPTGFYVSKIQRDRVGRVERIHDSRVVYGPWLEGVGSRNYPVTRFKGYQLWRKAGQRLEEEMPAIAERLWATHGPRMGG